MIVMEGLMLMPPERGTIIGRAVWKPRYVVLGSGSLMKTQNDIMAQSESSSRFDTSRIGLRAASRKPSLVDVLTEPGPESQGLFISIYKAKGDWEFLAQHPLSAFNSCEIRTLQHRKQGPSLPTLMLDFKHDAALEKQRKRRSSRTGGLSSKDPWMNTLLFRSIPEERYSMYDWHLTVSPKITPESIEGRETPFSPMSPFFNSFTNPFSPREPKTPSSISTAPTTPRPDFQTRSSSHNNNTTTSTYPHAPRDRPTALASPSPSLRSRRSNLSSRASSQHPTMGFSGAHTHSYNTTIPSDLPSPAPTSTSSYDHQLIEGWTSAQGRSSALSSHTRGSNSIASALLASSPPGPRETILDRAFQMRCIPGSERLPDDEAANAKLSSIARFEALMREVDERKESSRRSSRQVGTQGWDTDDDSDEDEDSDDDDDASPAEDRKMDDDEASDEDDITGLELSENETELDDVKMSSPAQRALMFISGRNTAPPSHRPLSPAPRSPPIPFLNSQAMAAFYGDGSCSGSGGLRPRTGTGTEQASGNPSTASISQKRLTRPMSLALPSRSASTATPSSGLRESGLNGGNAREGARDRDRDSWENRRSSTSVNLTLSGKRLSFGEFAKRLSSSSSLLLVQSNAGGAEGGGIEAG